MRYYIIAGEASGDLHGSNLILALRKRDSQAVIRFWGGDLMAKAAGYEPVRHIRDLAIMGFVEVVTHLHTILGNIDFCKKDILQFKPDIVIGVDYPGFNLKIERWAHQQHIRTVHYISPNLWAWKKNRINGMRRNLDLLCYILPFERDFFALNNMPQAVYVGHPLLDAIHLSPLTSDPRPIVALLPGSRRQELCSSLPAMVRLAQENPQYSFLVAGMSTLGREIYDRYIPSEGNIEILFDSTYQILSQATAAVVCSGTATLETALFNVPQVVCYRGNPISYIIARAVVGHRIRFISLVNLIADRPVVTELLQSDFNHTRLADEFRRITADTANRDRMLREYAEMRTILGDSGASDRTAQAVIQLITSN